MRQLCPNCATLIDVPADAAGTDFPCPNCKKPFAVPAGYAPAVVPPPPIPDRPPPPPGLAPLPGPLPPAPPAVPVPVGEVKETGFALSAGWLGWVAAGALAVAVLLSFFPWVGTYPGGVRQYSQTPWQAVFGLVHTAGLPAELLADEAPVETATGSTVLFLLPYLLLLLLALVVAVADRLLGETPPASLPSRLAAVGNAWPRRHAVLTGLTVALLLLVLFQTWRGYGLERAVEAVAADKATKDKRVEKLAEQADSTPKRQVTAVVTGEEVGRFNLSGTTARDGVLLMHLLAAVAAGGLLWLSRRGAKPTPRVVVRY